MISIDALTRAFSSNWLNLNTLREELSDEGLELLDALSRASPLPTGRLSSSDLSLIEERASRNDLEGRYFLGLCLYYGIGKEIDYHKAYAHFHYAAERGHHLSQRYVGECHFREQGVEKDDTIGMCWLIQAAEGGDSFSQFQVGEHLLKGIGYDQNVETALYWLCRAASQSNVQAQELLGLLFISGEYGVEKGESAGLHWLRLAAENGLPSAQHLLTRFLPREAKGERIQWLRRAAAQEYLIAKVDLAGALCNSDGVDEIREGLSLLIEIRDHDKAAILRKALLENIEWQESARKKIRDLDELLKKLR